ncbi:uncharacterized protein [Parasteatoda tepidariorum]|uniref:uncharacterized protein n=1 Tax=Parasteatoda tepidariorum TaxID=114398 RepID=UPI00077F84F6|nr:uncharacterized protein LOC107445111 [Parasteatoda tepidariorum]
MMQPLYIVLLLAFVHCVVSDGTAKVKQANQPAYQSVRQPYYRQYDGGSASYDYNNANANAYRNYDAGRSGYAYYPSSSYDTNSHYLHLSGGVYRPYDYGYSSYGAGYRPYAYDNAYNNYYDGSSSQYVGHPQVQYGASY